MTTTSALNPDRTDATASIGAQLSRPLVAVAVAASAAGIVSGGLLYAHRTTPEGSAPGTAAWTVHLCLFAAAAVILTAARIRNHRRRPGRLLVLAPLGRSAAARLRYAIVTGSIGRLAVCALPLLMCVYGMWRSGEQVLGGLDPNFTANAWGGPSYLGAMACHYLDGGLIIAASTTIMNLTLRRAAAAHAG